MAVRVGYVSSCCIMRIGHDPQAVTIAHAATAVKRVSSDTSGTSGISRIGEARTVVTLADAATAVKRGQWPPPSGRWPMVDDSSGVHLAGPGRGITANPEAGST